MSPLSNRQLSELRETLLQERQSLERRLDQNDHFGAADPLSATTGELSSYDNHPADIGSETFERGKDIALNEHEEHHLSDVKDALERMDEGTYGVCAICGRDIPFERLQAMPSTEYCIDHVPDRDISQRRPVEERLLEPPFGRTSLDELPEQNQFDGEDAWQIVESWGNSSSPAMAEDPEVHDYNNLYIEADENEGFVESYESFVATDLYGQHVTVVRNRQYREYMNKNEGDPLLEPDPYRDFDDDDGR
ncbi:TraR/DksA C4-type zinc finger protein [Paenibacillus flagellatus]|uniref:Molecular chaperone DnaK n=1 Tax=Paenibacillus flagellatus TaxID=2211139 RepID=A0A2V5K5K2_9BACL|nr:TraR/DksA C4-type zinc finger protein [Paenibacillus flagellatus]PYI54558.1 molecular chaperone DnaK [Paenibacillus flagellatus]